MMKLFDEKQQSKRNILILGEPGCGKRSFLLHYKDGEVAPAKLNLPEINQLTYIKKIDDKPVSLTFTLNQSSDDMIPSIAKTKKYDLIISLVDLSSDKAKAIMQHQAQMIKTHFPNVQSMSVGTKDDLVSDRTYRDGVISCSAKTGKGFDKFEQEFLENLDLDSDLKSTIKDGCSVQ